MTFEELVQEIISRGYDYMQTSRLEVFVKRAHKTLEARYTWPWNEKTKEGVAPIEIEDLRGILSVEDKSQERPLYGQDRRWLAERYPNLEEEGTPLWWWLENLSLKVFPTSKADEITIRYEKRPVELTGSAEPSMPPEWHGLIVDLAVAECLKDNDEYPQARSLKETVLGPDLQEMVAAEMKRDFQSNRIISRTGPPWSYL